MRRAPARRWGSCRLYLCRMPGGTPHPGFGRTKEGWWNLALPVGCWGVRWYVTALVVLVGCRSRVPDMFSYIPPSATVIARVDLDRVRELPIASRLPLDAYRGSHSLLLASDGKGLLAIAKTNSDVSLTGDPGLVAAARAQYRTGRSGAADLVAHAPESGAIWVVARGGISLPLSGNAANLSRLLRNCEYATVAVRLGSDVELTATAVGRNADAARQVEETLRAAITLGGAAEARGSALATMLKSIELGREGETVRVRFTTSMVTAEKLLGGLVR